MSRNITNNRNMSGCFMNLQLSRLLIFGLFVFSTSISIADNNDKEPLNAVDGIAMDGFDVVAYFREGKPGKGSPAHSVKYKGSEWLFGSAANAEDFKANPQNFEPQFNGWCAYAVSETYVAEVDFIDGWSVLDGKLYLNWNKSTRQSFLEQQDRRKKAAAKNWPDVRKGLIAGTKQVHAHSNYPQMRIEHPQSLE